MKKQVMVRAWMIAKTAVVKFGGNAQEYMAEALRMAWAEVRRPKVVTLELRQPNKKQKTWVAAIVGTHPVYKFERRFINPLAWGETTWELTDGIYEICENGRRYFIRVAGGDWSRIEAGEVMAAVA